MGYYIRPPTENVVPPIYVGDKTGKDLPSHYRDVIPAMHQLMKRYAQRPRGQNLWLMYDNSVSVNQPPNWNPADPTGPVVQGWNPITNRLDSTTLATSLQVKKVFWGGCDNPITDAERTILIAAGYGAYIHST